MKLSFFIIFAIVLFSCEKSAKINQEFKLKLNQEAEIKLSNGSDVEVRIKSINDSRCPPNVYCAWAGEAIVVVENDDFVDTLGILSTNYVSIIDHQEYKLQLIDVSYKNDNHFGNKNKAIVTLKIVQ